MSTTEITLNQAVDDAIEKLPWFRRRVYQRRLSSDRRRRQVMQELQVALFDDVEVQAMGLAPTFGAATFDANVPFEIDLGNLERLLQLIIEYLPTIFDIIITFINLFGAALLAVTLATAAGTAQAATLNPLYIAEAKVAGHELNPLTACELRQESMPVRVAQWTESYRAAVPAMCVEGNCSAEVQEVIHTPQPVVVQSYTPPPSASPFDAVRTAPPVEVAPPVRNAPPVVVTSRPLPAARVVYAQHPVLHAQPVRYGTVVQACGTAAGHAAVVTVAAPAAYTGRRVGPIRRFINNRRAARSARVASRAANRAAYGRVFVRRRAFGSGCR